MNDFENIKTKDIPQQYQLEDIRDDESDKEFIDKKYCRRKLATQQHRRKYHVIIKTQ